MKNSFKIVSLALSIFISGCATPYQPQGYQGGYAETKVSADKWLVTFEGNAFSSKERALAYSTKRAEEVCKQNGFLNYEITDAHADVKLSRMPSSYQCERSDSDGAFCIQRPGNEVKKPTAQVAVVCK